MTTLLAEITEPRPIVTPGRIIELAPTQTLSSITIGLLAPLELILFSTSGNEISWPLPSKIWQLAAIKQLFPITTD